METRHHEDAVFEITSAGERPAWWHLPATGRATYPLLILNRTSESHDVEITVAEAVEWASLCPGRLALKPGETVTTTLVLEAPDRPDLVAGEHPLTLEVRDFEGTCLADVAGIVVVAPRHRATLAAALRGPLMRRGLALGLVVRCTVTNEGNAECNVRTHCTTPGWTADPVSARVPPGGSVSFDMEIRWPATPMRSYPSELTLRARYAGGDCRASIPWPDAAASLGSLLPPLQEEEEFPAILELADKARYEAAQQAQREADVMASTEPLTPQETFEDVWAGTPPQEPHPDEVPVSVAIEPSPRRIRTASGGRLAVRQTPVRLSVWSDRRTLGIGLAALVAVAGTGWWIAAHREMVRTPVASQARRIVTPRVSVPVAIAPGARYRPQRMRRAVPHHATRAAPPRGPQTLFRSHAVRGQASTPKHHRQGSGPSTQIKMAGTPMEAKGPAWEGTIVHVSAVNVKVEDPATKAVRAFIVSPGFQGVLSSDGRRAYSRAVLRPGLRVRIFYSYFLGMRHANAILLLGASRH
jgi:hypothetical protein